MENIVLAKLRTVNYNGLLTRDQSEIQKLSTACQQDGFFFLDLNCQETQGVLSDWKKVLPLVNTWFDKPFEEKMKHHHGTILHGYTPVGSYPGVFEGTKDGNETIKVTGEAFVNPEKRPEVVSENLGLFKGFNDSCRAITLELLRCMSDGLDLKGETRFEKSHRNGVSATSCLNLIRYQRPENSEYFGQNKHTDNGSLTLLLTEQLGLQVLSRESQQWENVLPPPGHAVVNVADTLRFLSGKTFRSAVHRVIPHFAPDQTHRFSVGYFLRAEDEALVKDNDGNVITARQWHDRKYVNYVQTHDVQKTNSILLGGMEVQEIAT